MATVASAANSLASSRASRGDSPTSNSLAAASGALRYRARELGSSGVMLQGDAFHLPFADESFDKVICAEVMEHVHDYPAAARELARVTKPDGIVAVTIPTATSENLYLRLGDDYFRVCLARDDRERFFCLLVDTARDPPSVERDPSAEPNTFESDR